MFVLEEWKPKYKRLQGWKKSCECTNKSRWQPVHCFVAHYSQSVTGISFGPPLTSHQIYSNQCKFIYKVYSRLPQTCPLWSHKGNISGNKWRWTLRQQMLYIYHGSSYGCSGTAAFIIKLRKHKILEALWMNYMLITDLRCTTFKMFSFCLIAKVLEASRRAQLLQMLSCDNQGPFYLLQAPETVLTASTDVSCTTCAYLTHGAKNENTKFLRMIKKQVYL